MREVVAVYHRTKEVRIFPLADDRFLIEASLADQVHDVRAEMEVNYPTLKIVAARSHLVSGPFTEVCNLVQASMDKFVGLRIGRGFTGKAREVIGGSEGCHRVLELVTEIAQAAYQLHFICFFAKVPPEVRAADDVPTARREAVLQMVPGMRNTCFSYNDKNEPLIAANAKPLQLRPQEMPRRILANGGAEKPEP